MEKKQSNHFIQSVSLPIKLILLLWVIHLVQFLLHLELGILGIFPHKIFGLKGILFAPLIHSDWGHLMSNTPPLFVLSTMLLFFYRRVAIPSFIMIYLLTGLAVWLLGRPVFHIGASGVIYGLVAFIFFTGIFRRNLKSIVLALIVVFYYGSMFMGILPGQEGISWESHLLGALVGIFTAYWYRGALEKDEEKTTYSWENGQSSQESTYFLDRNAFEKTKEERKRENEDRDDLHGWYSSRTWK